MENSNTIVASEQTPTGHTKKTKKRLLSLDVLRGITIAGMITVNNPGTWSHIYAPLRHAAWNGCTPTDLVFPFFMFCMGVAMYISYSKFNFNLNGRTFIKVVSRGVLIVLVGWALSWYGMFLRQMTSDHTFAFSIWYYPIAHLRLPGVLPRLGIVSMLGALLLMTVKPKFSLLTAAILLVGYCIAQAVTNSFYLNTENMESILDLLAFGDNHIYHIQGVPLDPEGILSTIPCIAHVLIGAWVGSMLLKTSDLWSKVTRLLLAGSIMTFMGFILDYAFPINKALWSASYVLLTCGLASMLLGILTWILDIRLPEHIAENELPLEEKEAIEEAIHRRKLRHPDSDMVINHSRVRKARVVWFFQDCWDWFITHWYRFFESFGVNPLFIFCLSGLLVSTLRCIRVHVGDETYNVLSFWYTCCMKPLFGETGGSLASALTLVILLWGIGYILYKKKIYIKL